MWKGSEDEKAWCLSEEGIQKRVTSGRKKLLKSKGRAKLFQLHSQLLCGFVEPTFYDQLMKLPFPEEGISVYHDSKILKVHSLLWETLTCKSLKE